MPYFPRCMPQWMIDRYWEYDPIYDGPRKPRNKRINRRKRNNKSHQTTSEDIILDPNERNFYTVESYPHYHTCAYVSDKLLISNFKEEWERRMNTPRACNCTSPYVERPVYDPEAAGVSRVCSYLDSLILRDRARLFNRIHAGG